MKRDPLQDPSAGCLSSPLQTEAPGGSRLRWLGRLVRMSGSLCPYGKTPNLAADDGWTGRWMDGRNGWMCEFLSIQPGVLRGQTPGNGHLDLKLPGGDLVSLSEPAARPSWGSDDRKVNGSPVLPLQFRPRMSLDCGRNPGI